MWNRVVLLTCGMVIGWSLANYWSCAAHDLPKHRYRLSLGLIGALAFSVWLGWPNPASGVVALLLVALCALVSYAARARQISTLTPVAILADAYADQVSQDARVTIVVSEALPDTYTGPDAWAPRLRASGGAIERDSGWFTRPLVLARIRKAYGRTGTAPQSAVFLSQLVQRLRDCLDPLTGIAIAHPLANPSLLAQLVALARAGVRDVLVLPVDLAPEQSVALSRQIESVPLRERGISIAVHGNVPLGAVDGERIATEIIALSAGASPPPEASSHGPCAQSPVIDALIRDLQAHWASSGHCHSATGEAALAAEKAGSNEIGLGGIHGERDA
mgnify:FL=1